MAPPPCHGCCPEVESGIVEGANSQTAPAGVARASRPRMVGGQLPLRITVGVYAAALIWDTIVGVRWYAHPALAPVLALRHVGAVALVAGIFALIARLIRRRRWQGAAFVLVSLALLVPLVWRLTLIDAQGRETEQAFRVLGAAREQAREGRLRAGALRATGRGDAVVLANYLIGELEEGGAIAAKYGKEFAAVDLAAITAPESFTSPARAEQARAQLERLSRAAAGLTQELSRCLDAVDAEMEALPVSSRFRERVIRGYQDSAHRTQQSLARYSDVVDQFLVTCTELQALMQRERGHYVVLGEEVGFDHQEAADEYHRLRKRLVKLADEQQRVLGGLLKPADGSI